MEDDEVIKVEYFIIPGDEITGNLEEYLKENCFTLDRERQAWNPNLQNLKKEGESDFSFETKLINKKINLYRVGLSFSPFGDEGKEDYFKGVYENFNDNLMGDGKFKKVVKFHDDFHLKDLAEYQKEIYEIEMSLREIFTFIFLHRYKDTENFLYEYNIKNKENKTDMENEFFEFEFNNYIKMGLKDKLKGLENEDVLETLFNSDDFNKFKENLQSRGIKEEKHKNFIRSIKEDLGTFKDVRNNIAHNKKIFMDDKRKEIYDEAKENLKKKFDDFKRENFEGFEE